MAVAVPRPTPGRRPPEPLPKEAAFLHPGEILAGRGTAAVKTILGSCVSVCLWDPVAEVGGMNHFLLPLRTRTRDAPDRFGEVAMASLVREVLALGGRADRLRAKIFGGASITGPEDGRGLPLGARNVELARRTLLERHVPIVDENVGGRAGRRLVMRVGDGATWLGML